MGNIARPIFVESGSSLYMFGGSSDIEVPDENESSPFKHRETHGIKVFSLNAFEIHLEKGFESKRANVLQCTQLQDTPISLENYSAVLVRGTILFVGRGESYRLDLSNKQWTRFVKYVGSGKNPPTLIVVANRIVYCFCIEVDEIFMLDFEELG